MKTTERPRAADEPRASALRSPRWWSRWLAILLVGLLVAVAPMPFLIFSPEPPRPVDTLLRIDGAPRPLSGQLLASSVGYRQGTPALALWAAIDPAREIVPLEEDDATGSTMTGVAESFDESVIAAAAVGLRLAGIEAPVTSEGLEVAGVLAGSPAADVLERGDVLLAADGHTLVLPGDLRSITSAAALGDRIDLVLRRDGERRTVSVGVHEAGDGGRTAIGVRTMAIGPVVHLPRGVQISVIDDAEGGSAGLLLALAIYDRFANEAVLAGRTITGTGAIDLDGRVRPIDGIEQKVRAAAAAGVDLFLAPATQLEEARAAARGDLEVLSVTTVADAIDVLRSHDGDADTGQ